MSTIRFDFTDFVYEDGQFKFRLDDEKVGLLNEGIENVVDEAREVAISWSFDRIAEGWGDARYDYDENGIISGVEIENTEDPSGSRGIDDLFSLMETGRAGGVEIFPINFEYLTVFRDRFRTSRYRAKSVIQGAIEAPNPIEKAEDVMREGFEELISDLKESRWGGFRTVRKFSKAEGRTITIIKPRSMVRSLPNLYETYYKKEGKSTPSGVRTNAEYGNYGGSYRKNVFYK